MKYIVNKKLQLMLKGGTDSRDRLSVITQSLQKLNLQTNLLHIDRINAQAK